ncbi:MAG: Fic family protein [Verrucomicrobiae bacterium]|nr:Fic family protein [Verrucomicrobiae bacterium]
MSDEDPYAYPGTDVLKNNFGLRDAQQLDRIEQAITRLRIRESIFPPPPLTPDGYAQIHRHIFQDVYPWAGQYRTCELRKDLWFEQSHKIEPRMNEQFATLKEENFFQGLSRDEFTKKAAVHACELNDIHPFREGNGRTNRLFLEHLAEQAGHELRCDLIEPKSWIEASKRGFHRNDYSLMAEVLEDALQEPRFDYETRLRSSAHLDRGEDNDRER